MSESSKDFTLVAFAVRDTKADTFSQSPVFYKNQAVAIREFAKAVNDPDSMMSDTPEDFSLWFVGYWNDEDGDLFADDGPVHICNGYECVNKEGE